MNEELLRYVIGGGSGLLITLLTITTLEIPLSFLPFAVRTISIMVGASILGIWLADWYLDRRSYSSD